MFPMKFIEYLAAGLPVVGAKLPALEGYCNIACLLDSREGFVQAIEEVLAGSGPPLSRRLAAAAETRGKRALHACSS